METLLFKKLYKFFIPLILGYPFCKIPLAFAQEKVIHSLPIQKEYKHFEKSKLYLNPMPTGDVNASSKKVDFNRNPFQEPSEIEFPTIENLYSSLRFKGLVKSSNILLAIIETTNGQKFYKVGDTLENGFIIKFISLENVTVDISNGSKNYRLSLANIDNRI